MVLAPESPVVDWLVGLDAWLERSPGFFAGRAVVLDISGLGLERNEVESLLKDLFSRKIKVMALEGGDPEWSDLSLPPHLSSGGRKDDPVEALAAPGIEPAPPPTPEPVGSLLVDGAVRSGQSIEHLEGDVIVIGSVASGAEIIAGGSIHVYGPLRGRAIAGSRNPRAHIFCNKLEAELLAIDGLYVTADAMQPELRGHAVKVWLDGDSMVMTAQDKSLTGR
jgi:septum site-determining protein MinC